MSHARLDRALSDQRPSGPHYIRLVQLLHALHAAADPALAAWTNGSKTFDQLDIPLREPGFGRDLTALGATPLAQLSFSDLPRTAAGTLTDPAGIALLYVVAGSSVGARVLLRRLPTSVPLQARAGLQHAASSASAQLWARVLTLLALPAPAADAASGAAACCSVFQTLLTVAEGDT